MTMPWLTLLWAVPMVGAGAIMLLPAAQRHLAKYAALAISVLVLVIAAGLAISFDPAGAQYQFVEDHEWIPSFGTGYILGVDGIALASESGPDAIVDVATLTGAQLDTAGTWAATGVLALVSSLPFALFGLAGVDQVLGADLLDVARDAVQAQVQIRVDVAGRHRPRRAVDVAAVGPGS